MPDRRIDRVVMKRFVLREWLEIEPDVPGREYAALELVEGTAVPAPRPLAADLGPNDCDVPTVLMTLVPGRPRFSRSGAAATIPDLARILTEIHAVPHRDHPALPPYSRWYTSHPVTAPTWSRDPEAWRRAFEVAAGPRPEVPAHFIHRDFNPGNVLWHRRVLSGVVDWANACIGPRDVDVAHMRINLAVLGGMPLADRFLGAWRSVSGVPRYDPYWDVVCALEWLPDVPGGAAPHQLAPVDEFLISAMSRLR